MEALIAGNNLARGKAARFAPEPKYRRTTDGTESTKLTDGVWKDENLWNTKAAVGWAYVNGQINMIFDLGREEAVGRIVARFQGGDPHPSIVFPRRIDILLSADGLTYVHGGSLTRVSGGESELAKEKPDTYFYLPETGTSYVHPFVIDIQRRARFVALQMTPRVHSLFSDEVFIIESDNPETCRSLEGLEPATIVSQGVHVRPKWEELVITTNVVTPNTFYVTDLRAEEDKKEAATVFIELPQGIELKMGWRGQARRDESAPDEVNRWIIEGLWDPEKLDWMGMEGPVYFIVQDGADLPEDAAVVISTDAADSEGNIVTAPIKFVEVPKVTPQDAFHVSLTWMTEPHSYTYPDFLKSFRHLGFTGLGFFPRNAKTQEERRRMADLAEQAHEAGFEVVYNESPFHVMEQTFADKPEIFCQLDGEAGPQLCPTYSGPYYQKEMERVRDNAALIKPDIVFWDIELWYRGAPFWKKCTRCIAAVEASSSGDWERHLIDQGTRMIRDLSKAIEGTGPNGTNPMAGSYNLVADPPVYHQLFEFSQLYPRYLQVGMPVLYVRGDLQRVHDTAVKNHRAMGTRDIIPWITAGTYGEFPPKNVGQQIIELAVNGARGGTYYRFQDNDPMDYYHQAVALKALASHQELLTSGAALDLPAQDTDLTCSAWGNQIQALLLYGNYVNDGEARTITPAIAGRTIVSVTDAMTGQRLEPGVGLDVPAGDQRLLHCTFADAD